MEDFLNQTNVYLLFTILKFERGTKLLTIWINKY